MRPIDLHLQLNAPISAGKLSLREYNFAGLASALQEGLRPSLNDGGLQGEEQAVCLSVSPQQARKYNRQSNSLAAYTLQSGVSLGLRFDAPCIPGYRYGGYQDEFREPRAVAAGRLQYVMVPQSELDKPLQQLSGQGHEPRRPEANIAYLTTTVNHLRQLGGEETAHAFQEATAEYQGLSRSGQWLSREQTVQLQRVVAEQYIQVLQRHGLANPTLRDTLQLILHDHPRIRLASFDQQLRNEIIQQGTSIAAAQHSEEPGQHSHASAKYHAVPDFQAAPDVPPQPLDRRRPAAPRSFQPRSATTPTFGRKIANWLRRRGK